MVFDTHVNLLIGTVKIAPSPSTTGESLTLMPGDGDGFVANMPVTLYPDTVDIPSRDNSEIGYLRAVDHDQLTITRGAEGSIKMRVLPGWRVVASATAKTFMDLEAALAGKADASAIPDVSGKADKSYVDARDAQVSAAAVAALATKVDQVAGKGLSTNDYTTAEQTKLAGIAPGATQNASDAALRDRSTHTGSQAISTVTGLQTALDGKQSTIGFTPENVANKGAAGGYASLDGAGTIPATQLPSYVDDIVEAASFSALPTTGETGKIYVTLDTNFEYRWSGSTYIRLVSSPGSTDALAEGTTNLYFTNGRAGAAAPVQSVAGKTGAVTVTKGDVGLGNADNTSDVNKPVSTATQAALNAKQSLISLTTTGTSGAATFAGNTLNIPNYAGSAVSDATTTSKGIVQLAGDLGGTAAAPTVLIGRSQYYNFIPNPSFETSFTNWSDYGGTGTITRDTAFAVAGNYSMKQVSASVTDGGKISNTFALNAGTYTLSVYAKLSSDVTNACVILRGSEGLKVQINQAYPGNTNFNRYTSTFTLSGSGNYEILLGLGSYAGASSGTLYYDALQLEKSSTATPYFDGSSTSSSAATYSWTGAPGTSQSVMTTVSQMTSTDYLPEGSNNLYFGASRVIAAINGASINPNSIGTSTFYADNASVGNSLDMTAGYINNVLDPVNPQDAATKNFVQIAIQALTKASVGLGNVDNTSDANKPVSTAQAAALATKVQIGGELGGTPSAPTLKGVTKLVAVRDYGAVGDGVILTGSISSGSKAMTCSGASFTAADVGKAVMVLGAGNDTYGNVLNTTISSITSATAVMLATAASATVSGVRTIYGTDDTAAIQSALTAAANGGFARLDARIYVTPNKSLSIGVNSGLIGRGKLNSTIIGGGVNALVDNTFVSDLTIDSANNYFWTALFSRGIGKYLHRVSLQNWGRYGVDFANDSARGQGSQDCFVSHCDFNHNGLNPTNGGCVEVEGNYYNIHIDDSWFGSSMNGGCFMEVTVANGTDDPALHSSVNRELYVQRNRVYGPFAKSGYVVGKHIRVIDNDFYTDFQISSGGKEGPSPASTWVTENVVFERNTINTNSANGNESIIYLFTGQSAGDSGVIQNITFERNTFNNGNILTQVKLDSVINDIYIRNNQFNDTHKNSIWNFADGFNVTLNNYIVEGNTFKNWASVSGTWAAVMFTINGTGKSMTFNRVRVSRNVFGPGRTNASRAVYVQSLSSGTASGSLLYESNSTSSASISSDVQGLLTSPDLIDVVVASPGALSPFQNSQITAAGTYTAPAPSGTVTLIPQRFALTNRTTSALTLSFPNPSGTTVSLTVLAGEVLTFRQVTTSGYVNESGNKPLAQLDARYATNNNVLPLIVALG